MCRLLYCLLLVFVLLEQAQSGTFQINATHPDHPGRCFYNGNEMHIGQKQRGARNCTLMECFQMENGQLFLSGRGCGSLGPPPFCTVVPGDLSKPYPACCPELIC